MATTIYSEVIGLIMLLVEQGKKKEISDKDGDSDI